MVLPDGRRVVKFGANWHFVGSDGELLGAGLEDGFQSIHCEGDNQYIANSGGSLGYWYTIEIDEETEEIDIQRYKGGTALGKAPIDGNPRNYMYHQLGIYGLPYTIRVWSERLLWASCGVALLSGLGRSMTLFSYSLGGFGIAAFLWILGTVAHMITFDGFEWDAY